MDDRAHRFLNSGAFYRISDDKIRLFWGPFAPSAEGFDVAYEDFFSTELKAFRAQSQADFTPGELAALLEPLLGAEKHWSATAFSEPSFESFEKSFQIIQGKIQRGEIQKAVPFVFSRCERGPTEADLAHAVLRLIKTPMALHAYGFWSEGQGVIGATPEVLFHRKSMIVQTMALAGTKSKSEPDAAQVLARDPKEIREHELVVNDLIDRLKPLGWLKKSEVDVLELPTLFHLRTLFEVTGCAKRDGELVRHLHPTPALGVAPRAYGYHWMRELPEQSRRGLFGAPILFAMGPDETMALVAIRSLFWDSTETRLGSGCGIVAASELDKEWQEIRHKRQSLFQILGWT